MCVSMLGTTWLAGWLTIFAKEDHESAVVDELEVYDFAAVKLDGDSLHGADRIRHIIEHVAVHNTMKSD